MRHNAMATDYILARIYYLSRVRFCRTKLLVCVEMPPSLKASRRIPPQVPIPAKEDL